MAKGYMGEEGIEAARQQGEHSSLVLVTDHRALVGQRGKARGRPGIGLL
jgi:hypothetical protein